MSKKLHAKTIVTLGASAIVDSVSAIPALHFRIALLQHLVQMTALEMVSASMGDVLVMLDLKDLIALTQNHEVNSVD